MSDINISKIRQAIEDSDSIGIDLIDPIQEIHVGKKVLKTIKDELVKSTGRYNQFKGMIGSLFGIKIIQNKTLKPNQYKIIRLSQLKALKTLLKTPQLKVV